MTFNAIPCRHRYNEHKGHDDDDIIVFREQELICADPLLPLLPQTDLSQPSQIVTSPQPTTGIREQRRAERRHQQRQQQRIQHRNSHSQLVLGEIQLEQPNNFNINDDYVDSSSSDSQHGDGGAGGAGNPFAALQNLLDEYPLTATQTHIPVEQGNDNDEQQATTAHLNINKENNGIDNRDRLQIPASINVPKKGINQQADVDAMETDSENMDAHNNSPWFATDDGNDDHVNLRNDAQKRTAVRTHSAVERELQRQRKGNKNNKIKIGSRKRPSVPLNVYENDHLPQSMISLSRKRLQKIQKTGSKHETKSNRKSQNCKEVYHRQTQPTRHRSWSPPAPSNRSTSAHRFFDLPPSETEKTAPSKSIFVSRPSHWGQDQKASCRSLDSRRRHSKSPQRVSPGLNTSSQHHHSQKARLAAVASNSALLLSSRILQNPISRGHHSPFAGRTLNTATPMETSVGSSSPPPPAKTSFAPSFLPSHANASAKRREDAAAMGFGMNGMDVEDTYPAFDEDDVISPRHSFLRSPRRMSDSGRSSTRSRKSSMGGNANQHSNFINWKAKLQSIENSVSHDKTRLKSYPFPDKPTSRFDISDPRNNAKSYMDVTVLSDPIPCMAVTPHRPSRQQEGRGGDSGTVTVPAFLHNQHIYPKHSPTMLVDDDDPPALRERFVWISFSSEQWVQKDQQLRIYNAVVLACPQAEWLGPGTSSVSFEHMVLCTELCEPYPSAIFGPLPSVGNNLECEMIRVGGVLKSCKQ